MQGHSLDEIERLPTAVRRVFKEAEQVERPEIQIYSWASTELGRVQPASLSKVGELI